MALPIETIVDDVLAQFPAARLVIQAPPGAGKSTHLPLALLEQQATVNSGLILLLQPRRVAAVNIAHYLAQQLGESVGERVGYQVRGEQQRSQQTQLLVMTEGLLVRWLQQDPELATVSTVIFDEFHERNLFSDLGLALLLESLALRPSLSLLVMSATLPAEPIRDWLQQQLNEPVALLKSDGRRFPVTTHYRPASHHYWQQALVSVVVEAYQNSQQGVLVFVPGGREINQLLSQLSSRLPEVTAYPLHSRLSLQQQRKALRAEPARRIIVATNIAETSLTIANIDAVVDSGRERVSRFRPKYAANQLQTRFISLASAEQRAGRAGRQQEGQVFRLWSAADEHGFIDFAEADIATQDLTQLVAEVALWGSRMEQLSWLTEPSSANNAAAQQQLLALGMLTPQQQLTSIGKAAIGMGTDVRLARVAVAAGNAPEHSREAVAAALATLEEPQHKNCHDDFVTTVEEHVTLTGGASKAPRWAQRQRFWRQQLDLNGSVTSIDCSPLSHYLLYGFADRVGQRQGDSAKLVSGARVYDVNGCNDSEWLLVLGLRLAEQAQQNRASFVLPLTRDQLTQHPALELRTEQRIDVTTGRQAAVIEQQRLGELVLAEQRSTESVDQQQLHQALVKHLQTCQLQSINWSSKALSLWYRLFYLWFYQPTHFNQTLPTITSLSDNLLDWAVPYWTEVNSLADLQRWDPSAALLGLLDYPQQQQFQGLCPTHWLAPSGRKVSISYPSPREVQQGQRAVAALKLQEAFGEPQSPTLLEGKQALVLDLLSPAGQLLQRTDNLASFWQQSYPQVRKEMRGRYPKHPWPEDPTNAVATHKTKRQLL